MNRTLGIILTIVGLIALLYTGINYINDSESFGLFGLDITVSEGNIVPVIISGVVFILGLIILASSKK